MIKASDIKKIQKEKDERKTVTYNKIYDRIEKKILLASKGNTNYTTYEIPQLILGLPLYSLKECSKYVKKKLEDNGFKTELYEQNILLIKW